MVPETQVTVELESGREKREIISDDVEIPLCVSKWAETPRPQRTLIGLHVDVRPDEKGEIEGTEAKRTAHRRRPRRFDPAAVPQSGRSARVPPRPGRSCGPGVPAEIGRFSKVARRR